MEFTAILRYRRLNRNDLPYTPYTDKITGKQLCLLPSANILLVTKQPGSIRFSALPKNYVIKPNHMSGRCIIVFGDRMVITKKEMAFDPLLIIKYCKKWLLCKQYTNDQLWYHSITPAIVVEEYLDFTDELKFHVVHGKVVIIEHVPKHANNTCGWYSRDFVPMNIKCAWNVQHTATISRSHIKDLTEIVETELSRHSFDYVRFDTYLMADGSLYFGEWTFSPGGLKTAFTPHTTELLLGKLLMSKPSEKN